ncbi:Ig-like domain-containing protein [bacterium]|nr:Ig-like domain-containing protein [bacterium]
MKNIFKIDKQPVDKSKQYLWRYIQKKRKLGKFAKNNKEKSHPSFFAWLFAPKKIAWASAVAVLTIIAVLVGPNLQNLLKSGVGMHQNIAHANFEMTPSNQDSTGIDTNTTFTLTSTKDLEAKTIEANLKSTPDIDFNVTKTEKGKYEVKSAKPLDPNTVYTFSIISNNQNGPEEFSWAYQVKDNFKITGTLPRDKTAGVPITSGIEINFSHEQFNLEQAKSYITISPAIKGDFEKHQRTLVFVPLENLKLGTIYTVTVKEGLPLEGSDKTLLEGETFQFETVNAKESYSIFHFNENFYEVGTQKPIALKGYVTNYSNDTKTEEITATTDIYKFADQKAYLSVENEKREIPTWASATRSNYKIDTSKLKNITQVEGQIGQINWQHYIYLPDLDLKNGYYLIQVNMNNRITQALLQITDLSAYITVTRKDSLVWVNDIKTGKPIANANVKIVETGETAKTDKQGIAKFTLTPKESGYYNITINSPDGKSLTTELSVSGAEATIDNYWALINTDRPIYLPTDKIQFWGLIKPRTSDATPAKDLTLKLTRSWNETFVENVDFKIESNNTFSGSVNLTDMPAGYYYLSLYDGDTYLMQQSIQVQTYKKPTYNIKISADKNAYYAGENIHYNIKTEFFDGTPMPNLKLSYYDNDVLTNGEKTVTTDKKGEASVDQKATLIHSCEDSSSYCYDTTSNSLLLRPLVGEDSQIFGEDNVRVFRSHLNIISQTETDTDSATLNISVNQIDLDKLNNETGTSYNDYLGKPANGRSVKGVVTERFWEKIENGQYYDFIKKKVVKRYRYKMREKPFKDFTIETDSNGHAKYTFKMNPNKYYMIKLSTSDDNGKKAHYTAYAYNSSDRETDYYRTEIMNNNSNGLNRFNINDTVEVAITNGDAPLADLKGGKVLFLQYSNGLLDYSIENNAYYSFVFGEKHVPGVSVSSVWFNGDNYIVGWEDYAGLDTSSKELKVNINTDKDSYEPGEKVKLSMEVVNKDDKPVQAEVNLNLVDEAYYKAVYDDVINPMSRIYTPPQDGVLSTYNSHDNPEIQTAGDMGGCFAQGTQILMADGTYKAIEDIRKGDIIRTRKSPFSNIMVSANVINTVKHLSAEHMIINEELKVTKDHVLLINGKWNLAENIKIGDTLLGKDGEDIPVTSIKTIAQTVYVYNFEVEKYHTYIADNIYVHNDKGGDGVRNDFEDTAIFKSVTTDGNGKANVEFQVPDNITTWRVMATAVNTDKIQVGVGSGAVKVTLPLFGDLVMNKEYSVKDSPKIGVRAFGESLSTDDKVSFKLKAESLGLKTPREIDGKAYIANYQPIPKLTKGVHTIQLDTSANGKKDTLSEDILVRDSRLNKSIVKTIADVKSGDDITLPNSGYATVYLMDSGVSSYYGSLLNLYYSHGERFEKRLGEKGAIKLLNQYFNQDFTPHYDTDLTEYKQTDGGLAILPYADSNLELSALTVAFNDNYGNQDLKSYFETYYMDKDSNLEEITLSLLGLASMHEPVLTSLQSIQDEEKLSTLDKLYIGLAFETLGSKDDATKMYNKAIKEIDKTQVHENELATILAASLQYKDQASEHWKNVVTYADSDELSNLYLLIYVKEGLAHADSRNVSFNVKAGNLDENKTLGGCKVFSALVNGTKGIQIDNIKGDLSAVVFYEKAVAPSEFKQDKRLGITRKYEIVGDKARTEMHVDDIVRVTLNFSIDDSLPDDKSYHIVDIVPSGLQVLEKPIGFSEYGDNRYIGHANEIYNQEIHFRYYKNPNSTGLTRTYYAKVITPGKFYADPAKIEMFDDPEIANISAPNTVSISEIIE